MGKKRIPDVDLNLAMMMRQSGVRLEDICRTFHIDIEDFTDDEMARMDRAYGRYIHSLHNRALDSGSDKMIARALSLVDPRWSDDYRPRTAARAYGKERNPFRDVE